MRWAVWLVNTLPIEENTVRVAAVNYASFPLTEFGLFESRHDYKRSNLFTRSSWHVPCSRRHSRAFGRHQRARRRQSRGLRAAQGGGGAFQTGSRRAVSSGEQRRARAARHWHLICSEDAVKVIILFTDGQSVKKSRPNWRLIFVFRSTIRSNRLSNCAISKVRASARARHPRSGRIFRRQDLCRFLTTRHRDAHANASNRWRR